MPTETEKQTQAPTTPEVTTPTQPQDAPVETFDRDYVEKLRAENAKYRTRAKEAQDAAEAAKLAAEREKLDEVERLKAEKADAEQALEVERTARTNAERMASLTGKVADPAAALKLLDTEKHLNEDGTVNTEALLTDYAFLAPNQKPAGTTISGAGTVAGSTTRLAALEEQLANAKTRVDRVSIQSQIQELRRKQR